MGHTWTARGAETRPNEPETSRELAESGANCSCEDKKPTFISLPRLQTSNVLFCPLVTILMKSGRSQLLL